jgi:RNA polymerase sigma factor (sigma-70 family)
MPRTRGQATPDIHAALQEFASLPVLRVHWLTPVVESHGRHLKHYLQRRLDNRDLAKDAAQDVYLKLLRIYHDDEVRNPVGLAFRTASSLATDRYFAARKLRAEQRLLEPLLIPEYDPQLNREWEFTVAAQRFLDIAARDKPDELELILARQAGFSREEIANELGITVNAMEQRLTRAFKYAKEVLGTLGLEDADFDERRPSERRRLPRPGASRKPAPDR